MSDPILNTDHIILLVSLLLITGVLTTKFSSRLGVPSLVLFILVGILAGSEGLGFIYFDNAHIAQFIGMIALIIILFDGGMHTNWAKVKPVIAPSFTLATVGVILTAALVGVAAKYVLDVSWTEAFLFGSIVGSTDAAAVFSVLRGKNINSNLEATLEAESGSNDPMAMLLTVVFLELITSNESNYFRMFGFFLWQMGIGLLIGFLLGKIASFAINKVNLDSSGLYPVFALAFALLTYSFTDYIQASGLLAVYVAGIVIGNSEDLTYSHSIFRFNEGFAWMMQILMFVILGLLVFPSHLFTWSIMSKGLILSFVLIMIARPVAVFACTIGMKFDLKEKILLSWAGLKGAVPIVLATFPLIAEVENSQLFFNAIFFIVLISTLLQGSTISLVAKKLGLTSPAKSKPTHSLELISLGKANAEIMEFELSEKNSIAGKTLAGIDLPEGTLVNAIIRKDQLIAPNGETRIIPDDILYILVPKQKKRELRRVLHNEREDFSVATEE
ncbi:cell volume regulation protein A [Oikeobacillus pervagus]|uniref:Cell volume regulation protein A n=1 Tax=Oikeobacillus pervagus TaxID=1325931 RepID=A0AAJ1T7B0_9BACI|nr:potassium/proton antiporter [Oikeobacillus pervagus]MDQ0216456.1 cell volume regulation protein A [Oikeobacillus pervagus]